MGKSLSAVLTLVRTVTPLDESGVAAFADVLRRGGAVVEAHQWQAEGVACDLLFRCDDAPETFYPALRPLSDSSQTDIILQPTMQRQKKLLIADMDSTIVQEETLDELAAALNLKDHIAAITQRAMNGELDFAAAVRERVGLLKDLPETALEETWTRLKMSTGAETLVHTLVARDVYCILVSGGFTWFTARVAARLGFHEHHGNVLLLADGHLTGMVQEPIRDKHEKVRVLQRVMQHRGLQPADVIAVGDGANDVPMLQQAGLGVAYYAKPAVRATIPHQINHTDLRTVLYACGTL